MVSETDLFSCIKQKCINPSKLKHKMKKVNCITKKREREEEKTKKRVHSDTWVPKIK